MGIGYRTGVVFDTIYIIPVVEIDSKYRGMDLLDIVRLQAAIVLNFLSCRSGIVRLGQRFFVAGIHGTKIELDMI